MPWGTPQAPRRWRRGDPHDRRIPSQPRACSDCVDRKMVLLERARSSFAACQRQTRSCTSQMEAALPALHVPKLQRPLPTSGCPIVAMIHRTDCQTHRRSRQISRSGVGPSARGSGSVATSATRGRSVCVSVADVAMDGQESPLKNAVRPGKFVCQTVEELIEWMDPRPSDMRVAVEVGNASEVSRLAAMLAEGAIEECSKHINGDQCGGLIVCNR